MKAKWKQIKLAWALAFVLSPWGAQASVVLPADLGTLIQKAQLIVQGVVQSTTSSWGANGRQITSVTKIEVRLAMKGMPSLVAPMVIEVQTPGGIVGDVGQKVSGAPSFEAGEEVILFLKKAKEGVLTVESLSLGKFSIYTSPAGIPMVRQETDGLRSLDRNGQWGKVTTPPSMSVAELVQKIRQALSKGWP